MMTCMRWMNGRRAMKKLSKSKAPAGLPRRWVPLDDYPRKVPGRVVTGRGGRRKRKAWAGVNGALNMLKNLLKWEAVDPVEPDEHPTWGDEEPGSELGYRERRRQAKLRRRKKRAAMRRA